jgi:hypothetical protein
MDRAVALVDEMGIRTPYLSVDSSVALTRSSRKVIRRCSESTATGPRSSPRRRSSHRYDSGGAGRVRCVPDACRARRVDGIRRPHRQLDDGAQARRMKVCVASSRLRTGTDSCRGHRVWQRGSTPVHGLTHGWMFESSPDLSRCRRRPGQTGRSRGTCPRHAVVEPGNAASMLKR